MKCGMMFVVGSLLLCLSPAPAKAEIHTVPYVDVNKYLGDWYQIAHVPLWFEGISDCACARQRLTPTQKSGTIGVLNTCTKSDGSIYSIAGTADDEDRASNAKFSVSFQGVPFKGSYWIIGLDPQYRFAVVTDKGGDALYILSKTPLLPKALFDQALRIAASQVDTSKLVVTRQNGCSYPH
jgi:apolipoprotein D and lipocalin family protein